MTRMPILGADRRGCSPRAAGFSLLELLLALALGGALAAAALQLLLADGQGLQRLGRLLRERSYQERTLELIRGDVQRAVAISAQPELESHACPLAGRRPVLHLPMAQGPAVTYSVGAAPSGIWRGQVLMRCGPAFGLDGQPSTAGSATNRVVLDGLARSSQAWAGCSGLIGAGPGDWTWLNGSAREGFSVCRSTDGQVVGLGLHQLLDLPMGRAQVLSSEGVGARG